MAHSEGMVKLTAAQLKALRGETFYRSNITGITWATPTDRDSFTIRNDVFERLQAYGLIECTEVQGNVSFYALTDLGRRAIASSTTKTEKE